jgi:homoserine kinase type II
MAVYTQVAAEPLADFLTGYDIGAATRLAGIAQGIENSNYELDTLRGRFVLTLYERRVRAADLPFYLGLMRHLAGKGVPCPRPIARRGGALWGELCGKPAAIVTFLDGDWPRAPTAEHCRAVGAALAQMHLAGRDFPLARPNDLSLAGWRQLFAATRERADEIAGGLGVEIAQELAQLEAQWPRDLPDGPIHADLFPDNVFFVGDRLSGLIDFYFACTDAFAYDLAVSLTAWCFPTPDRYDRRLAAALEDGYTAVRPLAEAERNALPILLRGAALRFLLTRLYDLVHGVKGMIGIQKDPLEYRARLRALPRTHQ